MSPRRSVRVLTDAAENVYAATRAIVGDPPESAWAMHLAGPDGYFRWVCFDLDAKGGNVAADARRLRRWLRTAGLAFVECLSGDSGGRHFWLSADRLHPQLVNLVGRLAKSLLGSLDTSMLGEGGAGAVRPPYSPHRVSGYSKPLGDVEVLFEAPALTERSAAMLVELLEGEGAIAVTGRSRREPLAGVRGVVLDGYGNHKLAGTRREPSARVRYLLEHGRPAAGDGSVFASASELQFAVLCGLVRARWAYRDVEALLEHSPGLAHAASAPASGGRVRRPVTQAKRLLRADWEHAVEVVSSAPSRSDDVDDDFLARVATVTAAVEAAQARANASPGLWGGDGLSRPVRARRGRPSYRSVLDAVCWYMLRAAATTVEVNTRRLAADTGYSHEACRQALHALTDADLPWLVRVQDADGRHAPRYQLAARFERPAGRLSTENEGSELAQVATPPAPAPPLPRWRHLTGVLGVKLSTLARDVFCSPGSLGRAAGRVLQLLPPAEPLAWTHTDQIASRLGSTLGHARRLLRRLHSAGLVHRQPMGWARTGPSARVDPLEAAAVVLGVDGYLAARADRYTAEQGRWEWWLAEVAWLNLPRDEKRRTRRARGDGAPLPGLEGGHYPAYPRREDRSPDHVAALQTVRTLQHRTAARAA